ncbi:MULTISPECIES: FAD-binding oxidoreductase [Bifidobacterium]|jgi:glycolate oxidase|uniref:FAD-binding oxidoreductase n=1 Tax=Bifidobacterium TaxID=1678 RepID=UPI00235548F8|nr:FAD-binding protein [Bifidobacterium tibiigranuli]MCI1221568.1 FAD-binding protein [Bifidobacterium tibiigranuli]
MAAAVTETIIDKALFGIRNALQDEDIETDPSVTAPYAEDKSAFSGDARLIAAVLLPETTAEVQSILRICNTYRIPVTTRGSGTGLVGGAIPVRQGFVLSTERLNAIRKIDPIDMTARVQTGVVTDAISDAASQYGLFYAPDPASSTVSSIGGNIATNAGGLHCVKYGVTRDNVLSLQVVLADGSTVETGRNVIKNVAGLDLTGLFVGSEGLLGVVTEATVRLRSIPAEIKTVGAVFSGIPAACSAINGLFEHNVAPAVLELMEVPQLLAAQPKYARFAVEGAMVLVQIDGSDIDSEIERVTSLLRDSQGIIIDAHDAQGDNVDLLNLRKSRPRLPREAIRTHGDVAVPRSAESTMFGNVIAIARQEGLSYTAIAHAGDGNIHTRFFQIPVSEAEVSDISERVKRAQSRLFEAALAVGGTLTGEHGVGIELAARLPRQLGEANMKLQRGIKRVFDPNNILNPGKWLDADDEKKG